MTAVMPPATTHRRSPRLTWPPAGQNPPALPNKAQVWTFEALQAIRQRLHFPLLNIDSDNGSEFINHHLLRYCQDEHITFTRSRAFRKNDKCFIEQKNYTVVRRAVGYARYDTAQQLRLLNELYQHFRNPFRIVFYVRQRGPSLPH